MLGATAFPVCRGWFVDPGTVGIGGVEPSGCLLTNALRAVGAYDPAAEGVIHRTAIVARLVERWPWLARHVWPAADPHRWRPDRLPPLICEFDPAEPDLFGAVAWVIEAHDSRQPADWVAEQVESLESYLLDSDCAALYHQAASRKAAAIAAACWEAGR